MYLILQPMVVIIGLMHKVLMQVEIYGSDTALLGLDHHIHLEFLATGTPVMINNGVGDSGRIVQEFNAGVVLPNPTATAVKRGIPAVRSLLEDQDTQTRCRAAAKRYFDVSRGSEQYAALYRRLIGDLQTTEGGIQA